MKVTEEQKQKAIGVVKRYWYILVLIGFLAFSIFQWQQNQSTKAELTKLKASISITEDIHTLELKLDAMHEREADYLKMRESQEKLLKTLDELDARTKELNKLKKERIKIDVEKLSSQDLSNTFNSLGFPNTVVSSK